jgi:hypothetical protein
MKLGTIFCRARVNTRFNLTNDFAYAKRTVPNPAPHGVQQQEKQIMKQLVLFIAVAALVGCSGDKSPVTAGIDSAESGQSVTDSTETKTTKTDKSSSSKAKENQLDESGDESESETKSSSSSKSKSSSSKAKSSSSREPEADTGASEADISASEPEGDTRSSSSSKEAKGSPSDAKGSSGKVTASSSSKEVESSSDTGEPEYCRRAKDTLEAIYPFHPEIWLDDRLTDEEKLSRNGHQDIVCFDGYCHTVGYYEAIPKIHDMAIGGTVTGFDAYYESALTLSRKLFLVAVNEFYGISKEEADTTCSAFTSEKDAHAVKYSVYLPYCNDTLHVRFPDSIAVSSYSSLLSCLEPLNATGLPLRCSRVTAACELYNIPSWRDKGYL